MATTPCKPFRALPAVVISAALMTIGYSTAWAHPMGSDEQKSACAEQQHGSINDRLDKMGERLEIKASQQAAWEAYAKAYKALADRHAKKPDQNADAVTFARYHAKMATELAKKLTSIADATAKLQAVLSEDQRKIFNRITRHSHHRGHEWCHQQARDGNHEWPHHGDTDQEGHPGDQGGEAHGDDEPQQ